MKKALKWCFGIVLGICLPAVVHSVGNPKSKSWWHYEVVRDYLSGKKGVVTLEGAQECLSKVHWVDLQWEGSTTVEDTQWCNVYDQATGTLSLRSWNEYDKTYIFSLE